MEAFEIALLSVVAMLVLIYLGMHIAVTLALISFVGAWVIKGNMIVAVNLLWISAHQTVNSFVFAVIPLFVLMGFLVSAAGMGRDAYDIGQMMLRRVLGGLGMATVVANAIFAAITGVCRLRLGVFKNRRAGNDPPWIFRALRGRYGCGLIGSGNADSTERAADHLRADRRGICR